MDISKRDIDYSLYVIIDQECIRDRDPARLTEEIISGGATLIQYRNKSGCGMQFFNQAGRIHHISQSHHVPLIINDRVDIAMAIGAEGVHLGQEDIPVSSARRMMGSDACIGLSVSHVSDLNFVKDSDYLGVGAMFPTQTKMDAEYGGVQLIKQVRAKCGLPLVGIGGINENNCNRVLQAGADGVAVISAVMCAENPASAVRQIKHAIQQTRQELSNASIL